MQKTFILLLSNHVNPHTVTHSLSHSHTHSLTHTRTFSFSGRLCFTSGALCTTRSTCSLLRLRVTRISSIFLWSSICFPIFLRSFSLGRVSGRLVRIFFVVEDGMMEWGSGEVGFGGYVEFSEWVREWGSEWKWELCVLCVVGVVDTSRPIS
jgi:hypothetical protein